MEPIIPPTGTTQVAEEGSPRNVTSTDVSRIICDRRWLSQENISAAHQAWFERVAAMLGPHAHDDEKLAQLLQLIFQYDAREILSRTESHAVLARYGSREAVRRVALMLLDGRPLDSERLKEMIIEMKATSDLRSRDLFHPIRLALAGRAGEGELDRVILLLDEAAALPFTVAVKSARTRILEFCSSLD